MLLVTMNADFASRCGYNRRESTMFLSVYTTGDHRGDGGNGFTGGTEKRRRTEPPGHERTRAYERCDTTGGLSAWHDWAVVRLVGVQSTPTAAKSLRSSPCLRSSC